MAHCKEGASQAMNSCKPAFASSPATAVDLPGFRLKWANNVTTKSVLTYTRCIETLLFSFSVRSLHKTCFLESPGPCIDSNMGHQLCRHCLVMSRALESGQNTSRGQKKRGPSLWEGHLNASTEVGESPGQGGFHSSKARSAALHW